MSLFSLAKLFGITIRESATDGSDFTNPDADYRRLFLGEDGQLHVKDSAGAVTNIGGAVADILDLPTAEMDDTLVLAPDATGGVEWRTEAGGTGGVSIPTIVQVKVGSGSSTLTLDAAPVSGHSIILVVTTNAAGPTDVASANTTWTKLLGVTSNVSLWVGVAAGSAGAAITFTGLGGYDYVTAIEITDTLTPTLGASTGIVDASTTDPDPRTLAGTTAGRLVVFAWAATGTGGQWGTIVPCTIPSVGLWSARVPILLGYAHADGPPVMHTLYIANWYQYLIAEVY